MTDCSTTILGQQGSSVGRSLLLNKNKRFLVRVVTRNPSSEKAQAIAALGAELVKADAFMEREIEAAFQGSWAVFINNDSGNPVRRFILCFILVIQDKNPLPLR
jgi:hypothetical protein